MTARPVLLLLLALLVPAAVSAQDHSRAIFQSWIGRTLILELPAGRGQVRFETDSTSNLITPTLTDSGRWRWDDAGPGWCVRWQKLRNGQEACFTITSVGRDHYIVLKGTNEAASKVIEVK